MWRSLLFLFPLTWNSYDCPWLPCTECFMRGFFQSMNCCSKADISIYRIVFLLVSMPFMPGVSEWPNKYLNWYLIFSRHTHFSCITWKLTVFSLPYSSFWCTTDKLSSCVCSAVLLDPKDCVAWLFFLLIGPFKKSWTIRDPPPVRRWTYQSKT